MKKHLATGWTFKYIKARREIIRVRFSIKSTVVMGLMRVYLDRNHYLLTIITHSETFSWLRKTKYICLWDNLIKQWLIPWWIQKCRTFKGWIHLYKLTFEYWKFTCCALVWQKRRVCFINHSWYRKCRNTSSRRWYTIPKTYYAWLIRSLYGWCW